MNHESQRKPNFGLANRRLQPLGHLSNGRNPYSSSVSGSNGSRDSGDSTDSGDSGEVAKEVTRPPPAKLLSDLQESQKPAPDMPPRPPRRRHSIKGRRSQKESQIWRLIRFRIDVLDRLQVYAKRRRTSPNELAKRIVETVLDEGLVDAVLDDAS